LALLSIVLSVPSREEAMTETYRAIVIDPPWRLPKTGLARTRSLRNAVDVYPTMSVEELAKLPIGTYAAADCHLWLWVTDQSLEWGLDLMKKWGFKKHRIFPWDKGSGTGNFIRNQYEYLLFGYRGKMTAKTRYLGNKITGKRGPHSTKPIEAYERINLISFAPVLEIFARPAVHLDATRAGWTLKGLDIDGIPIGEGEAA
jgi:N6-adenosine-specific RNA methylase IME4